MIFANLKNIKDHIDEINTLESYSERTYLGKSSLIIPFINIDLLRGKFLELKNYSRVEFAYLLLQNVRKIEWAGTNSDGSKIVGRKIFATKQPEDIEDYFAVNRMNEGYELKIDFNDAFLYIPKESRIGKTWFTVYDTPVFPKSVDSERAEEFWSLNLLDPTVKDQLKFENYEILEFTQGTTAEVEEIEKNWFSGI